MKRYAAAEVLFDIGAGLAEGPAWDASRGRLSFVDIEAGRVHVASLERIEATVEIGTHVGAAIPAAGGGYLIARRDGFVRLAPDGSQVPIALPLADVPRLRFNDGKADPQGRAWAGTMPYDDADGLGVLYRLDGTAAVPAVTGTSLSNGLGWSADGRTMYFIDTRVRRVDAFDYDALTAMPSRRRVLIDFGDLEGAPDGMCVDDDGCLWVAAWDGAAVHRFAPDGRRIGMLPLPVSRPTSCCFAGDVLVVTSAAGGLDDTQRAREPHAGAVFACRPGVSGPPATSWVPGA